MSKRRFHQLSIAEHRRNHEQILQALGHALDFLQFQSRNEMEVAAQLDFHILMPHLFPMAGNGSKPLLPNIREWILNVLQRQEEIGLRFYLTGPTFLEFLDQIKHHSDTARDVLASQIDRLTNDLDPIDEEVFISSQNLQIWLSALTKPGFEQTVRRPVQELIRLIDNGLIRGVGDLKYMPSSATLRRYSRVIRSIFNDQCARRLTFDRTKRSDSDSRFHYKIDAANIGISKILENEANFHFYLFTRTQSTIRTLSSLARSDQSLPVLLRLQELDESIADRMMRLQDAIAYGQTNLDRLTDYSTVVDIRNHLAERMLHFYKQYGAKLFYSRSDMPDAKSFGSVPFDDIREILLDKKKLQDGLDRAVSELQGGATTIAQKLSETVRLDVIEDFDLSDDPVYQKLRKELRF